MSTRRGILDPEQLDSVARGDPIPKRAAHYLADVLRLGTGDPVELADGEGRLLHGHLERTPSGWALTGCRWSPADPTDLVPITLLAALLKPKRWRLVVEKAVELGVRTVVPVLTQHVAWRPPGREIDRLVERWNRLGREASKQCRRTLCTRVTAPSRLDAILSELVEPNRLLAHLDADRVGWPDSLTPLAPTAVLVGPEGGLTQNEVDAAIETGFEPIALGGFPLRTETAVAVILGLARDRLGFAEREHRGRSCP